MTKKLAGRYHGTAQWMTSVGNEYGQVLNSVLTDSEGDGLTRMLEGLFSRYENAVPPEEKPKALYVDRDCCSAKLTESFSAWPDCKLRLDIWHFMRRLASGVTTDAHPLYKSFMGHLSDAIFVWYQPDLRDLMAAKKGEMEGQGIRNPSEEDVARRLTREEKAAHCRRATRGAEETRRLISNVLEAYGGPHGRDMLGLPLLDSPRMDAIWQQQQKHLPCIQDPPGVALYTQTGTKHKGGVELPVFRCARGSTSLESFHLHLNRFILGNTIFV